MFLLVTTMTSENPNYGGFKYPEVENQAHVIGLGLELKSHYFLIGVLRKDLAIV